MAMQTVYVLFGLFIMMALTKSFRTKFINYRFSMIMYFVGLASMCVCVLWTAKGSHAWIHVGPITIQPAEFMKVAMILILSYMLTETDAAFVVKGRFRTAELKSQFYKDKFIKCVLFPLGLMLVAFFVGAGIQKDLGTSLILASICFICFMSTPRDYYKKYKKTCLDCFRSSSCYFRLFNYCCFTRLSNGTYQFLVKTIRIRKYLF